MQPDRLVRAVILLILMFGIRQTPAAASPPQVPARNPGSPAFRDFTQRVHEYLKLHKSVPRLRSTKHRAEIVERRHALAQKIREMRSHAKPGDIFTPEVSEEFRRVIRDTFQGPTAANVRKTLRQGEPVPGWHLTVNSDYPEHLPVTTVLRLCCCVSPSYLRKSPTESLVTTSFCRMSKPD